MSIAGSTGKPTWLLYSPLGGVATRSPEANALKDIQGAPTLVAVSPDGKELGRVEGLKPAAFVAEWLQERVR